MLGLIAFFALAVAGVVALVMGRPPRAREPESLLPPRQQAPLRAVRPLPAPKVHAVSSVGRAGHSTGEHHRGGRAAA
jgi:hypothetical protein